MTRQPINCLAVTGEQIHTTADTPGDGCPVDDTQERRFARVMNLGPR